MRHVWPYYTAVIYKKNVGDTTSLMVGRSYNRLQVTWLQHRIDVSHHVYDVTQVKHQVTSTMTTTGRTHGVVYVKLIIASAPEVKQRWAVVYLYSANIWRKSDRSSVRHSGSLCLTLASMELGLLEKKISANLGTCR